MMGILSCWAVRQGLSEEVAWSQGLNPVGEQPRGHGSWRPGAERAAAWFTCACLVGECPWNSGACAHGGSLCLCSLQEKLWAILQATYTHSRNLACFVFTYKGLCALQSHVQGETYQVHSFLAAFIGGLLVFGHNNNINSQVKTLPQDRGQGPGMGGGRDVAQV